MLYGYPLIASGDGSGNKKGAQPIKVVVLGGISALLKIIQVSHTEQMKQRRAKEMHRDEFFCQSKLVDCERQGGEFDSAILCRIHPYKLWLGLWTIF